MDLTTVFIRHERRVRLFFTEALAAGAFTSTTYYAIQNQDSLGASPAVLGALIVPNSPNCVELLLADELVKGAIYVASVAAVPGVLTTATGSERFRFGATTNAPSNSEPAVSDLELVRFGRDLLWQDGDYLETVDGDLATIAGRANAQGAIERRLFADGLVWAPQYGPNAEEYVDATPGSMGTLRGSLIQQVVADRRFKSASVDMQTLETEDGVLFSIKPVFADGVVGQTFDKKFE
jgi:hypothetical protein